MKQILLAATFGLWGAGALAHAPLEATIPLNGALIAEVPSEVVLDFKGEIRLTRVSVAHGDHPGVDLDLRRFRGFISTYAIPFQGMGSGVYVIEWRGLGRDGHTLNGSFSFTVE